MCSNSSKWVTKRDREIKIYIFEHCVGGGGDFLLWLGDLLVAGIKDKAAKYTGSPLSSLFFTHSAKKILLHFNSCRGSNTHSCAPAMLPTIWQELKILNKNRKTEIVLLSHSVHIYNIYI